MYSKACSRTPYSETQRGFSLSELLIAVFISSALLGMMTALTTASVRSRESGALRTETELGLRSLLSMVSQELRQAGACLPRTGGTVALSGENNGLQDILTLRIGKVSPSSLLCIQTYADAEATAGDLTLTAFDASALPVGSLVYVTENGAQAEVFKVTAIAGNVLTLDHPLPFGVPIGGGIFAVEERTYSLDTSDANFPVLTVSIDGAAPVPLVDGVVEFDLRYYLGPCALDGGTFTCDQELHLPSSGWEWYLVHAIGIKAKVRSRIPDKDGTYIYASTGEAGQSGEYVMVKPRNLMSL